MKSSFLVAAAFVATAALPGATAAAEGAVAVRDPETGALRAPTAAELATLRGRAPAEAGRAASAPVARKRPGGGIVADVPESLMQHTVVQRHEDGTLSRQCVQGADAAEHAVSRPSFAKRLSMSTARTARGLAYEER